MPLCSSLRGATGRQHPAWYNTHGASRFRTPVLPCQQAAGASTNERLGRARSQSWPPVAGARQGGPPEHGARRAAPQPRLLVQHIVGLKALANERRGRGQPVRGRAAVAPARRPAAPAGVARRGRHRPALPRRGAHGGRAAVLHELRGRAGEGAQAGRAQVRRDFEMLLSAASGTRPDAAARRVWRALVKGALVEGRSTRQGARGQSPRNGRQAGRRRRSCQNSRRPPAPR